MKDFCRRETEQQGQRTRPWTAFPASVWPALLVPHLGEHERPQRQGTLAWGPFRDPPHWAERCSTKIHAPATSERDRVWKWGLRRCNQVKMKSHWSRVDPKPRDRCPQKKMKYGQNDTQGERCTMTEAEAESTQLQAKDRQGRSPPPRSWARGVERVLPESLWKEPALLTRRF